MSVIYIYLGLYVLLLLSIALYVARKENKEDFLISNRDRAGWQILLSKFAGSIGATWFITYTAFAFEYGLAIYGILFGFVLGYFSFAYWAAPRIYEYSREKKFYTQSDFVLHATGSRRASDFATIITILMQFLWLLTGVVAGSQVIAYFDLLSYEFALVLTLSVILLYTFIAGFKAVVITDIFQSIIIFLLLVGLSFVIFGGNSFGEILSVETESLGVGTLLGFLIYGSVSVFALADRYQLCYAAKDLKSLKRGMGFAIGPLLVAAFFLVLIGLFVRGQNPGLDPGVVFIFALESFLPLALLPLAVVLFFAGLMSSADTSVFAIASHYTFLKKKRMSVSAIRLYTAGTLLLVLVFAYFVRDVVALTVFAAAFGVTLSLPMMYLISGGRRSGMFFSSLLGSLFGLLLAVLLIGVDPAILLPVVFGGGFGLVFDMLRVKFFLAKPRKPS